MILPTELPPTAEKLEENGIFLLHSSNFFFMFIGQKTSPEILSDLFGTEHVDTSEQVRFYSYFKIGKVSNLISLNYIFQSLNIVEELDSAGTLRQQVRSIVEYLHTTTPTCQPLEVITKSDWRSNRFMSALVEDRTRNDVSYVEFLCQVHKKIQYKSM